MAAKGPNFGNSGLNIKSGKRKTDFDDLMLAVTSEEEDYQYEMPEPELIQNNEVNLDNIDKETQDTVDLINQMIQKQNEEQEQEVQYVQVTPPVTQKEQEEQEEKKILQSKNKEIPYDPSKPFNQQQPRKITNQRRISEEIQEDKPLITNNDSVLSLEKEEEVEKTTNQTSVEKQEEPVIKGKSGGRLSRFKDNADTEPVKEEDIYTNDIEENAPEEEEEKEVAIKGRKAKKGKDKKAKKEPRPKKEGRKKEKKSKTKGKAKTTKNEDTVNTGSKKGNKLTPEKLQAKGFPRDYYDPTDMEIDPETGEADYFFNIEKTLRNKNMIWISKVIPMSTLDRLTYDKKPLDAYAKKQHEKAEKLNASTPEEQYQYENRKKIIKFLSATVCVLAVVFFILFSVLPSNNYDKALDFYAKEDWPNAFTAFTELGDYKNAKFYGKYSEGKVKLSEKKFDEAKADFTLLLDYQEYFERSIQDEIYNCDYQKAIKKYSESNFEEAMEIFATIPEYAEAKDYYYKAGYEIADNYYESGDYDKSLDAFFRVKAYSDATERLSELADQIYTTASNDYKNKEYSNALNNYQYLAKYNYKDSKSMIDQCNYRFGLDRYNNGEYEEARDLFSKVLLYKDSNAMYKECTYKIAKIEYAKSIEGALAEYSSISDYRDVPEILSDGVFSLYGEWTLTEMNGSKTTPVDFKFNKGGLFQTSKQVLYTAISTDATPIPYKWNGECYTTEDARYTLSAEYVDENTIKLTCADPEKSVEFTCVRKADYLTMLENNDKPEGEETEEQQEISKNQAITNIIQEYINKKTDGTLIIDEKEYNCPLIIQQINDNLN